MRRGVTIIELLMVMIILGVVAAIAVPRIDMNAYRADAAARAVRGVLQIAQRSAITRQSNVIVTFDSTSNRMTVLEDINDNGTADAGERLTNKPLEEKVRFIAPTMGKVAGGSTSRFIAGSSLQYVASQPRLTMRRDGSSSSDAEIYLTVNANNPKQFRAITVDPSIGKTELYRYSGSVWSRMTQ
jgi:prepilin-type N-terminal cleavage/methylation domain-containing protein